MVGIDVRSADELRVRASEMVMARGRMKVIPVQCSPFANHSERTAVERLKACLVSTPGDGEWILLTNLPYTANHRVQAAEIDIVAIGPPGVRVIEVKHWSADWVDQNQDMVGHEAHKVTAKARRIGTNLRRRIQPDLSFVKGVFLVTPVPAEVKGLAGRHFNGVPMYTLKQWRQALNTDAPEVLSRSQVSKIAKSLYQRASLPVDGSLERFADFVDLSIQSPAKERFHRIYKAMHATSRESVILHIYDLSAGVHDAETRARREFDALRRVREHHWAPQIRDPYHHAPDYPGEMAYFTIDDPEAPSLSQRKADQSWDTEGRLEFALKSLQALRELHSEGSLGEPLVHRSLSPDTILVRHNNLPILTGFDRAKIPEHSTVATVGVFRESNMTFVAPEIRNQGLAVADQRSDVYQLCASLIELFSERTDELSGRAWRVLRDGTEEVPRNRKDLRTLERAIRGLCREQDSPPVPPPAEFWTAKQEIHFGNHDYEIVEKLGQGGIGIAYKVARVGPQSQEARDHYVAKVVPDERTGLAVLESYRRIHPHLRHSALSAIFDFANEWQDNSILALLTWVEGEPLTGRLGELKMVAEDRREGDPQACLLDWLRELCKALGVLHGNGLVHGDVSPGNLILTDSEIVLTDYDTVTRIGCVASLSVSSLYCSPSRAEQRPAEPSDDFYALATSFFHALFGTKPFQYGGNLEKDRGLNWEGIDSAEFPVVRRFLDRATEPNTENRYSLAGEALADLSVRLGEGPRTRKVSHRVQENDAFMVEWYRTVAEQGDMNAQYWLGSLYRKGSGVAKDEAAAVQWFWMAAEQGHAGAQHALGDLHYLGHGLAKDDALAAEWYRRAAEQGHAGAQDALGDLHYLGDGVAEDRKEAAKWWRRAAEQGHADAQYEIGRSYYFGSGVTKDEEEAAKWYRKAAEQDHANSQYEIGVIHFFEEDYQHAAQWYRKAARQGHPDAQYWLGNLLRRGVGVAEDCNEAANWWAKAAERGNADASCKLGSHFLRGCRTCGVERDCAEAAKWYRKAVEQGDMDGHIGSLNPFTEEVEQDYSELAQRYREYAEDGNVGFQYWLGRLYDEGRGLEQNYAQAAMWYGKAANGSM